MAFLSSLWLVLIAEMGDKTQLLTMALASKYKARDVAIGVTAAIVILNGLAVALGSLLGSKIDLRYIQFAAAASFLGFGLWTLKGEEEEEEIEEGNKTSFGPVVAVAVAFFLAELGDKTQLATVALSAEYNSPLWVLLGSTGGMILANAIGVVCGAFISKHVPDKFMKLATACIFIVFGIVTLYKAVPVKFTSPLYVVPFIAILAGAVYFIGFRKKSK